MANRGVTPTTENLGRAMLHVARHGYPQRILENGAVNEVAQSTLPLKSRY